MSIAETFLPELEKEAAITRRVIERVPEDKLAWKPHEKSMSLARLATHTANVPGDIVDFVSPDELKIADSFEEPALGSVQELLDSGDRSVAKAKEYLAGLDDAAAKCDLDAQHGRPAVDGKPAHCRHSFAHVQPLVSPPRSAYRLPAVAERPGALGLRAERRREPVRVNEPSGLDAATGGDACCYLFGSPSS